MMWWISHHPTPGAKDSSLDLWARFSPHQNGGYLNRPGIPTRISGATGQPRNLPTKPWPGTISQHLPHLASTGWNGTHQANRINGKGWSILRQPVFRWYAGRTKNGSYAFVFIFHFIRFWDLAWQSFPTAPIRTIPGPRTSSHGLSVRRPPNP